MLFGAICALLVFGLQSSHRIDALQRGAMDSMVFFRWALQPRSPHPDIVLVVADDTTVHADNNEKYPLPRSMYAEVVRRLQRAGACRARPLCFAHERADEHCGQACDRCGDEENCCESSGIGEPGMLQSQRVRSASQTRQCLRKISGHDRIGKPVYLVASHTSRT